MVALAENETMRQQLKSAVQANTADKPEVVIAQFAQDQGFELTVDDINQIRTKASEQNEALQDEDLDNVSGGGAFADGFEKVWGGIWDFYDSLF
ncbi:MAG: Nif11-like leader peptide family RiPP precursor [Marinobacter sp.]